MFKKDAKTEEDMNKIEGDKKAQALQEFYNIVDKALEITDISNLSNESMLEGLMEDLERHPIGMYGPLKNKEEHKKGVKKVGNHINELLLSPTHIMDVALKMIEKMGKYVSSYSKDEEALRGFVTTRLDDSYFMRVENNKIDELVDLVHLLSKD